jgi:hypothetical protein
MEESEKNKMTHKYFSIKEKSIYIWNEKIMDLWKDEEWIFHLWNTDIKAQFLATNSITDVFLEIKNKTDKWVKKYKFHDWIFEQIT